MRTRRPDRPERPLSGNAFASEHTASAAATTERMHLRAMVAAGINPERRNAQQAPGFGLEC
jgi:hypothetical protein